MLSKRMSQNTRLSNGFSRKVGNHMVAVALNYFAYKPIHQDSLNAADVAPRWQLNVSDLVNLLIESASERRRSHRAA